MPAARLCDTGREPRDCCDHCIIPKLGDAKGRRGNRRCPAHADTEPSLSVNPGVKGMRMVWCCGAGCEPHAVRDALLDLGISPSCLGSYGKQVRTQSRNDSALSRGTIADAKRWHAITELPVLEGALLRNPKLVPMCIQAIREGNGDLPGDHFRLLPVNKDDFLGLAKRAGIDRCYRYRLYDQWVSS